MSQLTIVREVLQSLEKSRILNMARLASLEGVIVDQYVIKTGAGSYIGKKPTGLGGVFGVGNAVVLTQDEALCGVKRLRNGDGSPASGEVVHIVKALNDEVEADCKLIAELKKAHPEA